MNEETQNKDSYQDALGFSQITADNWWMPDRKGNPPSVAKADWGILFLKPQLDAAVPKNIVQLFEIARGCMIQSWYFYPLATLALEQIFRIGELAARERCKMLPQGSTTFFANLQTLFAAGVISANDEPRWQAVRRFRNDRSHLESVMLIDSVMSLSRCKLIVELINNLFNTPGKDWVMEWETAVSKYLGEVLSDSRMSRNAFPNNACPSADWPIPFFGDPAKAVVATVGVNPASTEFDSVRKWTEIKSEADWIKRLRTYFTNAVPSHKWFEPWRVALELIRLSYENGTVTHLDVSYRATTAMLKNPKTDPAEFRRMVEQDGAWFFQLLVISPRLKGLLVFGPVVRSDGTCESLAQFIRVRAQHHGFSVLPKGGLQHNDTGRTFFIHEVETPGETCVTCRVAKNLYANRDELRLWLK